MIELPENAQLKDFQTYIHALEKQHGWLDVDLVHNCFLMGEEVGELFKSIRKYQSYFDEAAKTESASDQAVKKEAVAEELVDVFNYLLAISNRLEIDFEAAFKAKNEKNQHRTWEQG